VTVENPDAIDQITRSEDGAVYTLDMIETRPLTGSQEQLQQLIEKINGYVEVIQTGRLLEAYPEMQGKRLNVRLVCMHEPTDARLIELLGVATRLFAKHHADFGVQIIPRNLVEQPRDQGP
jgi:hypothetical protein